jgi:hypothetical protein
MQMKLFTAIHKAVKKAAAQEKVYVVDVVDQVKVFKLVSFNSTLTKLSFVL